MQEGWGAFWGREINVYRPAPSNATSCRVAKLLWLHDLCVTTSLTALTCQGEDRVEEARGGGGSRDAGDAAAATKALSGGPSGAHPAGEGWDREAGIAGSRVAEGWWQCDSTLKIRKRDMGRLAGPHLRSGGL